MEQVKAFGPQDLRVVQVQEPIPGEGEVLVDVHACGICGSDKWFWFVEESSDYVAGHEVAGQVTAIGPGVKNLKAGDRVAVNNVRGCGECEACKAGQYVRCVNEVQHMGFGFSEKVIVPERNCLPLHDDLSYEEGSLIFDNWGTPYASIRRTSMKAGDTVLVIGCGPIGLAAISLSKHRGADVIALDPVASRRTSAERIGASAAWDPSEKIVEEILATHPQGVDVVLECSGQGSSYETAMNVIAVGGTIASIGEGAEFTMNSSRLIHKHLSIVASLYSTMEDGQAIQDLIVQGAIDPTSIVTHRFTLENLPQQFEKVIECSDGLLKSVVLRQKECV